jgi:hypothetical protein
MNLAMMRRKNEMSKKIYVIRSIPQDNDEEIEYWTNRRKGRKWSTDIRKARFYESECRATAVLNGQSPVMESMNIAGVVEVVEVTLREGRICICNTQVR